MKRINDIQEAYGLTDQETEMVNFMYSLSTCRDLENLIDAVASRLLYLPDII